MTAGLLRIGIRLDGYFGAMKRDIFMSIYTYIYIYVDLDVFDFYICIKIHVYQLAFENCRVSETAHVLYDERSN
jgi:hypothetical protein